MRKVLIAALSLASLGALAGVQPAFALPKDYCEQQLRKCSTSGKDPIACLDQHYDCLFITDQLPHDGNQNPTNHSPPHNPNPANDKKDTSGPAPSPGKGSGGKKGNEGGTSTPASTATSTNTKALGGAPVSLEQQRNRRAF